MANRVAYVNTASSAAGNGTTNATSGTNRAYASSQEAESAEQAIGGGSAGNLPELTDTVRVVCEGSAEDTGGLTINGWVTDGTYGITWEAVSGAGRHDGTISGVTNGYKLTRSDDRALGLASTGRLDLKIRGFVIRSQSNHFGISDVGIGNASGRVEIESMIVYSSTSGSSGRGINIAAGTAWIWNTFVYGYDNAGSVGYGIASAGATIVAENVTVRRCRFGFVAVSGSITCYNCIVSNGVSGGYSGPSGGSHNVSYTSDAPGTNNTNSSTPTYLGTDDCRLNTSDTVAKDTGTDRSGGTIAFSTDIAGTTRPQNGTWDRGCFEIVAAAGGDMSGTSSGAATTSATLTGLGALSGVIAGLAATSAFGNTLNPISGTSDGIATTSALLTALGALSGTSDGLATVAGAMLALMLASGTADGVATTSGTLTGLGSLSGLSDGLATSAALLTGLGALSGSSAGVATVTGSLFSEFISGVAQGIATVSGTLTGVGAMSGASNGLASTLGVLTGIALMNGQISASATADGLLVGIGSLAGLVQGSATTSAALGALAAISGVSNGSATVTGFLSYAGQIFQRIEVVKMTSRPFGVVYFIPKNNVNVSFASR